MGMQRQIAGMVAAVGLLTVWTGAAQAQSLGTFSWQLQPYCDTVTVQVTQNGGVYTLDGYDDQCGAAQRAPLTGLATPNPDGTIGFGLNIVTVPGGKAVSIDARITLAGLGGSWTDSAGNSGTFVLGGQAAGAPRPAPAPPSIVPGSVTSASLAAGAVTTTAIADGTVGAADIDVNSVQQRISTLCPRGAYFTGVASTGVATCSFGDPLRGNVSLGSEALGANASGFNTAVGMSALASEVNGSGNVAVGYDAMRLATDVSSDVAVGLGALRSDRGGNSVAIGAGALGLQTLGSVNTAVGAYAMEANTTASANVAIGYRALPQATEGNNTAVGYFSLSNATGGGNVALGRSAGSEVTAGFNNIHIWHIGEAADNATIRIGAPGIQTRAFLAGVRGVTTATGAIPVLVGTDGQLGTVSSSRRYKFDIADMDDFSVRLAKLRPVTFRYKQPMADGSTPLDFGLIAEEVAEVFPELAVTGADGQIETVAYHKLPALLPNELQKQQRVIRDQTAMLASQGDALDLHARQLDALRRAVDDLKTVLAEVRR